MHACGVALGASAPPMCEAVKTAKKDTFQRRFLQVASQVPEYHSKSWFIVTSLCTIL